MANISKRNRRRERELRNAAKNRREIIAAQLSRRDMMKAGLLTSAGYLIHKNGLSARAQYSGDGCDNRWRRRIRRQTVLRRVRLLIHSSSRCQFHPSPSRLQYLAPHRQ